MAPPVHPFSSSRKRQSGYVPELEMIISRCGFAVEQRRRSKAGDEGQLWVDLRRLIVVRRAAGFGASFPFPLASARVG